MNVERINHLTMQSSISLITLTAIAGSAINILAATVDHRAASARS
jgi:hypothetical protein